MYRLNKIFNIIFSFRRITTVTIILRKSVSLDDGPVTDIHFNLVYKNYLRKPFDIGPDQIGSIIFREYTKFYTLFGTYDYEIHKNIILILIFYVFTHGVYDGLQ